MRQTQLQRQKWWLALSRVPRFGGAAACKLLEQLPLAELFSLSQSQLQQDYNLTAAQSRAILAPDWPEIEHCLSWCEQHQVTLLPLDDPAYPERLRQIGSPPPLLFARGDLALLDSLQLAVVGARTPSANGRQNCQLLVEGLVNAGLTITSGLALGIDACAHQAALANGGVTVAVLGSGLSKIYPTRNRALAEQMVTEGRGLLLSEFWPGVAPKPENFPRRNRIVSGLALGTLVVEAAEKSGSLITARLALEQGREVFAVPGAIGNPMARGCHWLIKQGAKLVETPVDILEELVTMLPAGSTFMGSTASSQNDPGKDEGRLPSDDLLDNLDDDATPIDVIVARTQLSVEVVLQRLLELEMQGLVAAVPGGYMRLRRTGHV